MANRVEKEYAKALFELCLDEDDIIKKMQELNDFNTLTIQDNQFFKFLNHPLISKEDKKNFIDKILKDFSIKDFLKVLIDNERINCVNGIIEEFEFLYYDKKGIMPIEIVSFEELPLKAKKEIIKRLEAKFEKQVNARFVENKEILGGIVLKYNGQVIDNSCLKQLSTLRDYLIN